ncbi:hypothetical protein SLEP1_g51437 [Rubroshorea leprosula]|uniref:DYW domain-containing protein n=1 Tax=Rubroshorea leprosula TaxID=152421 RepID=A0AAV5M371_9ROSI|nr:hypothetical protein SLEP1_g51437 [Rubroshorea leprosula]
MPSRNLTSWDTMITWLPQNGLVEDVLDLFIQFKKAGLKHDGQMFIGVFSACSILGDINEGMLHFESMSKDYGIITSIEHYGSVVEMLGGTGYLDKALEFIEEMPFEPSVDVLETLMNLCKVHGHLELGDRCLIPVKASDLAEIKKKKLSSHNLLTVKGRVHEYRAVDRSHPENQEGKEEALLGHSETLAVVHGLMTTAARSLIRVINNLRFCGDCHTSMKIISKIVGRQLIMRDAKRFHHFQDGLCSCKDYWILCADENLLHAKVQDDGEEVGVPESYQLCRKKSTVERMKGSLVRVKRVMWLMLGSALETEEVGPMQAV